MAKFLGLVKCPLRHFDISENALGDVAAAQICDSLRQVCRGSLQGLRMAKNLAGGAFGPSMQALLSQAVARPEPLGASCVKVHLQSLDLHWNKIDGSNAAAIFQGAETPLSSLAARIKDKLPAERPVVECKPGVELHRLKRLGAF